MSSKAGSHSAGTSVAFDLGANSVRVVEVEWSGSDGSGRLVKRGSAALPVNVWNDLPANSGAFVAALRQAMSSAGIAAKSVSASLPRRLVTLRFARLPHAPPEQMRGLVAFEAQQYVLFPLDEVILDYHVATDGTTGIAAPSADDMESVLLAAARRSLIIDLIAIFEKAGLELEQLTVSALALAELIRDAIEPTAVIDVEPGEMDVAVVANRQLLFTRASGLDVSGAQPEIAARRLADEVARSFTSFQNEYRQQALVHINLTGPSVQGAEGMAVEQTLGSVLEMHIGRLSSRLLPSKDTDAIAYATAVGTALQTRPGSLASINLVPDERAVKKAQQTQRRRQQFAVATSVVTVALLCFFVQRAVVANAKEKAARLDANDKLRKFNDIVDAKRKQFQKRKALYEELGVGLDRSHPSIDILVALNRALPQTTDIWLTQFAFDRSGIISLHGETKSATAATDMVIALQDSGAFSDVKLAYLGDAQESNVAANDMPAAPPAAATAANAPPVVPLPPMQPANGSASPAGRGGAGAAPAMKPPVGGPGGPLRGLQPNVGSSPPGSGFPGGMPPGVKFSPGMDPRAGGFKIVPNSPPQSVPAAKVIDPGGAPPPFYLIGYGQAPPNPAAGSDPVINREPGQSKAGPTTRVTSGGPGSSIKVQPGTTPSGRSATGKAGMSQGGPTIDPAAAGAKPGTTAVPTRKPSIPAVTRPRGTLTSFIITCRVNPQARTMLTGPGKSPAKSGKRTLSGAADAVRRPIGAESDNTDSSDTGGEPDAAP